MYAQIDFIAVSVITFIIVSLVFGFASYIVHSNKRAIRLLKKKYETERRAAEAIQESEAKYKSLFETSLEGIGVSKGNQIISATQAVLDIFGYNSLEEFTRIPLLDHVAPESREMITKRLKKRQRGELLEPRYHYKIIRQDGEIGELEMSTVETVISNEKCTLATFRDITERKRAEEALKESELWFRSMYSSLEEAVLVVTPDRILMNVNIAGQKMFGYSEDELRGFSTEKLHIDHEHYLEFGRKIEAAFDKGEAANFEFQAKRKNGEVFPTEHTVSLLKNDGGDLIGIVSIVRDITERKRAEEELKKHHDHLEELVAERTDELTKTNERLQREITGRERVHNALKHVVTSVPTTHGEDFFASLLQNLVEVFEFDYALIGLLNPGEGGEVIHTIALYAHGKIVDNITYDLAGTPCENVLDKGLCVYPDNVQRLFPQDRLLAEMGSASYAGTPLKDSAGNALGIMAVLDSEPFNNTDSVESLLRIFALRVAGELERKQAEEKLRDAEENLKNTFDISPGLICIANANTGYFTDCNPAVTRILGVSVEEFTSRPFMEFIHPDDRQRTVDEVTKQLKGSSVANFENRYRCKDGSYKWLAWQATEADKNGKVHAVATDITERKRVEEALRKSEEFLAETSRIARVGGWDLDLETMTPRFTDETYRIYGLPPTEPPKVEEGIKFYAPEARPIIQEAVQEAIENGTSYDLEVPFITAQGEHIWVRTIGDVEFKAGKAVRLYGFMQDITERKQAEENLQRENAYVKLLQEVAVAANESSSIGDAFQLCIDRVCELTAWPVGHVYLLSKDRTDLMEPIPIWHVDDPEQFQVFVDVTAMATFETGIGLPGRVLASGKPAWIIDVTKDKNFTRARMAKDIGVKAGFAFPVLIGDKVQAVLEFFSPQSVEPDERLLEIMAHIGTQIGRVMERQQAEGDLWKAHDELERRVKKRTADLIKVNRQLEKDIAKRKQAEREVIKISEEEQRRIAQDLHDDLGQQLIGIAYMFEVLSDKYSSGETLNMEDFTRIEALTAEAIERLHAVALDLHPISVEGSDLSWSLQKLTENMQTNYGIICNFKQQGELPHFEREIATNIYRIAQEAANNAVKHGAPSQVHISLDTRGDELVLAVKDDGVGIAEKELVSRGMGLKNMEYRSDLIGAKLDIIRGRDGGTVVSCSIKQNPVFMD